METPNFFEIAETDSTEKTDTATDEKSSLGSESISQKLRRNTWLLWLLIFAQALISGILIGAGLVAFLITVGTPLAACIGVGVAVGALMTMVLAGNELLNLDNTAKEPRWKEIIKTAFKTIISVFATSIPIALSLLGNFANPLPLVFDSFAKTLAFAGLSGSAATIAAPIIIGLIFVSAVTLLQYKIDEKQRKLSETRKQLKKQAKIIEQEGFLGELVQKDPSLDSQDLRDAAKEGNLYKLLFKNSYTGAGDKTTKKFNYSLALQLLEQKRSVAQYALINKFACLLLAATMAAVTAIGLFAFIATFTGLTGGIIWVPIILGSATFIVLTPTFYIGYKNTLLEPLLKLIAKLTRGEASSTAHQKPTFFQQALTSPLVVGTAICAIVLAASAIFPAWWMALLVGLALGGLAAGALVCIKMVNARSEELANKMHTDKQKFIDQKKTALLKPNQTTLPLTANNDKKQSPESGETIANTMTSIKSSQSLAPSHKATETTSLKPEIMPTLAISTPAPLPVSAPTITKQSALSSSPPLQPPSDITETPTSLISKTNKLVRNEETKYFGQNIGQTVQKIFSLTNCAGMHIERLRQIDPTASSITQGELTGWYAVVNTLTGKAQFPLSGTKSCFELLEKIITENSATPEDSLKQIIENDKHGIFTVPLLHAFAKSKSLAPEQRAQTLAELKPIVETNLRIAEANNWGYAIKNLNVALGTIDELAATSKSKSMFFPPMRPSSTASHLQTETNAKAVEAA